MAELSEKASVCKHCGKRKLTVELDEDTYNEIDFHGVESLQDVDQAVYEGMSICGECYSKEGGII